MATVVLDRIEPTRKNGLTGADQLTGFTVTFRLEVTKDPWVISLDTPSQSADAAIAAARTQLKGLLSELSASVDEGKP